MPSTSQQHMPRVTLRRAVADDAQDLASLLHAARLAAEPQIPASIHSQAAMQTWFEKVLLPTREVWVAVFDDVIAALMVLDRDWIDQLYVRPGWTGRGLGKLLLDQAKTYPRTFLQLWTFQSNTSARRFYEREGFAAVEQTDGSRNEEKSPDVRYQWTAPRRG